MKELRILQSSIEKPKNLLKFPELIKLELVFLQEQKSYKIIDFSSLIKLKNIIIDSTDFININYSPLEKVILNPCSISFDLEKKIIEKIFSIKTIEKLDITIFEMNIEDISNIIEENTSLKNLLINLKKKSNNCNLTIIEEKLPNLDDLMINQDIITDNSNDINLQII